MSTEKEKLEQTHSVDVGVGYQQDGGLSNQMTGATVGGLHRRLDNRQIQLVAAGGSIGTALFISIGGGLARGGPASLFLAYLLYSCVLALVNNSVAEMSTHMPVAGGFVRLAGEWVDDAWGFMAGWNFFLYEALCIPFEITALTFVISFWDDRVTNPGPTAAICAICIILYAALNILAVSYYGEAEFWLSGGKLILIFLLFAFTFVTMCGGNPQKDAYGFRYWSNPGAFAEYRSTGDLGRFEGFLAALWSAGFTVVGPEYISMVAAESKHPSIYIKSAFKTVYFRFCLFFVVGALAVSVVIPYNDPALYDIYFGSGAGSGSAAGSPYVIAMRNLNIKIFPSIVNALIMTSIFSAGNTYTYVATRTLYSMSLEGRAPKFLNYTNRKGVPVWCFCVVMIFPFLSFLQVGSGSAVVLNWFVSIITGGGLINYIVMGVTFICYYKATVAQGFDRKKLPYYGWFQPYGAYIALAVQSFVVLGYGYSAFGPWNVSSFFQSYTMQIIAPITFLGWKFIKGTKFKRSKDVDLVWERPGIDLYESTTTAPITGFWEEMGHLVGIRKRKQSGEA